MARITIKNLFTYLIMFLVLLLFRYIYTTMRFPITDVECSFKDNENMMRKPTANSDVINSASNLSTSDISRINITNMKQQQFNTLDLNQLSSEKSIKPILNLNKCNRNVSSRPNTQSLVLCGQTDSNTARIFLFTTMYYSVGKMFVFKNVIEEWISLGKAVQPILFLNDASINASPNFIQEACAKGWIVLKVPLCNTYEFPVLKSMFIAVEDLFPTGEWVGYANGDILFNKGLTRTLDYLHKQPVLKVKMVVGQRSDMLLKVNQIITTEDDFMHLSKKLRGHHAIDYFITPIKGYPWSQIPPLVVGRSGFDTWIVWWTRSKKFIAVDATESIKAAHQGLEGLSRTQNSHVSRTTGLHSNDIYTKGMSMSVGRTQCLKYKTQDLYNNDLLRFPDSGSNNKFNVLMLKYTVQSATLRILLENGYNYTELQKPEVQRLLDNFTLMFTLTAGHEKSLSLNSTNTHLLTAAQNKYLFLTYHVIMNILQHSNVNIEKYISNIVLMERVNYPQHCKQLHDPRVIPVKIIHAQKPQVDTG